MEAWVIGLLAIAVTVVSNIVTWAVTSGRREGATSGQIKHLETVLEGKASDERIAHLEAMLNERKADIARIEKTVDKIYDSRHALRAELQEQQKGYWFEVKGIVEALRTEIKRMDGKMCNICQHKP